MMVIHNNFFIGHPFGNINQQEKRCCANGGHEQHYFGLHFYLRSNDYAQYGTENVTQLTEEVEGLNLKPEQFYM